MWRDRARRRRVYSDSSNTTQAKKIAKIAKFGFIGVILLVLGSLLLIPIFAISLPSPDKVVRHEGFSTKIYDRNGKVLYDIFSDERRSPVKIADVPEYLKKGTIAIEDKNFYEHEGFDILGTIRGLSRVITRGRAQGGSTLTQQLVKNVLLTSDRNIFRKLQEFILATQIENKYTKDEIMQMYFNETPYGGNAIGVETAAETYFGKNVSELNLVESAFLAGLPQRPTAYSPYSSTPKAYIARTTDVLRRMREDGHITKQQEEEAKNQLPGMQFQAKGANFKAPHFVQYVQKILEERYGAAFVENGGLQVTTTLDLELQEEAQKIVAEEIEKVANAYHITNGAAITFNPETGEILSMVGSKDFNADDYDGQVNVTTSLRQPGSSIKPITYVAAFKEGFTPATLLMDVPTVFPGSASQPEYKPVNYDGKFRGPVQMRYALGNSLNIAAVKTLARVGVKDMLTTAYDLGITSLEPTKENLSRLGLSVTLGGGEVRLLELTNAYGAFVNGGFKAEPIAILEVKDKDGKVLEKKDPKKGQRVISEEDAFLIADILSDNNARKETFGTNSAINIAGRQVAVKTGTTNDRRDNWTIGGTPQEVTGVWVGNNDNSEMKALVSGVSGAAPIWRRITLQALKGKPNVKFAQPNGVVTASVDIISGFREHDGYPSRTEYFKKGTEPNGADPIHTKLKICKNDGKLATPADISGGNYDEKEFFVFK
ncbi:MAG: PBP1A family penicillin-binding protein, partial [Patescibacteria group bacterium]